jgi:hypothetical protein
VIFTEEFHAAWGAYVEGVFRGSPTTPRRTVGGHYDAFKKAWEACEAALAGREDPAATTALRATIGALQGAQEEERARAVAYLKRVAATDVGTILTKQSREVVDFCAHWLENGLHEKWAQETGFQAWNPTSNDRNRITRSDMGDAIEKVVKRLHDMTGCSPEDARSLIPELFGALQEYAAAEHDKAYGGSSRRQDPVDDGPKEKNEPAASDADVPKLEEQAQGEAEAGGEGGGAAT